MNEIIDYYSRHADRLIERSEKLAQQAVHAGWKNLVPEAILRILDYATSNLEA